VFEKESGQDLKFSVGDPCLSLGAKLEIQLPALVDRRYLFQLIFPFLSLEMPDTETQQKIM
jgi:hypothetical protein